MPVMPRTLETPCWVLPPLRGVPLSGRATRGTVIVKKILA